MKVKIIKANGVKKLEQLFDLDFLQQHVEKNTKSYATTTGDFVATKGDSTTSNGTWTTYPYANNTTYSYKLYSSTS